MQCNSNEVTIVASMVVEMKEKNMLVGELSVTRPEIGKNVKETKILHKNPHSQNVIHACYFQVISALE